MEKKVQVQEEAFDLRLEYDQLRSVSLKVGAVVTFTGTVRDLNEDESVQLLQLEHYPGMTEKQLADIEYEAHKRWDLNSSLIIHRYGRLEPGDNIVLVACASSHRENAFDACHFLIDWLKTRAPFWKLEETPEGGRWVEAKTKDDLASARWEK